MDPYESQRFLRADLWSEFRTRESDQSKGIPAPPVQKPAPAGAELIDLIAAKDLTVGTMPLIDVINKRRSRRSFEDDPLTLEELSFLLWVTQGVQRVVRDGVATLRAVPSGGARHPFETYLWVNTIEGLDPGLYRYLPVDHKLCVLDRHTLSHGVALQHRITEADRPRLWAPLSESLSGRGIDRCGHVWDWRI